MVSLIFFSFVAIICVLSIVFIMIRRRKMKSTPPPDTNAALDEQMRSNPNRRGTAHSAYNRFPSGGSGGRVIPTDAKRKQPDDYPESLG